LGKRQDILQRERPRHKNQLLLGDKNTLNEALRKTLEMEVVKLAVKSPLRLRKTSDKALWRSWLAPKRNKRLPTAYVPAL
jgi:hypothetical protein